jgi:hypothetical protein
MVIAKRCGCIIKYQIRPKKMEVLAEIVGFIVFEVIFSVIGWVCLYAWYRNRKKMEEIKNKEYAGEYSSVGRVMLLNLIAGVGAISMFGIVIFILISSIYKAISD